MKTNFSIAVSALLILIFVSASQAVERKRISEVDYDKLLDETTVSAPCDDNHMNLVFWLPYEWWEALLAQDPTIPSSGKKAVLQTVKQYSIFMIVQADVSRSGVFRFYTKAEIAGQLDLTLMKKGAGLRKITIAKAVDPDLKVILGEFAPIFSAAMGHLGKNTHLYIVRNVDSFGHRQIDPYSAGSLNFRLSTRNGTLLKTKIEMPLDSLHVPRKCPNGKDAHITWKYCPWTGKKLPE